MRGSRPKTCGKRLLLTLAALVLLTGCRGVPVRVCTDNRLAITTPVQATVKADLQAGQNREPLRAVTVQTRSTGGAADCKIAIIDVDGLLVPTNMVGPYSSGENPVALFREKLDLAAKDPSIRAVILRIDTPGGGVTACDMMRHDLMQFREKTGRPVVAFLMGTAAGGGYYLATGADAIVAHPTSITGGIGVVLNLYNLQDTMAQMNIFPQTIKSGPMIDMGSPTATLTPEAKAWLQQMSDEFHARFRQVVLESRPVVGANEPTNFDGRVFTAGQARQRGLIDEIGYLETAISVAESRIPSQSRPKAGSLVMFRREGETAHTPWDVTPNTPLQTTLFPVRLPGLQRPALPLFLYMWQLDPAAECVVSAQRREPQMAVAQTSGGSMH